MSTHYKPKKISQITNKDLKVVLIGKVSKTAPVSFVLDDDSGKIEIFSDKEMAKDTIIRVFCSITNQKLKADIIQILDGLDMNLFKNMEALYNKVL